MSCLSRFLRPYAQFAYANFSDSDQANIRCVALRIFKVDETSYIRKKEMVRMSGEQGCCVRRAISDCGVISSGLVCF